ncbi:MAG: hypothetical protein ACYCX9_08275, partial [Candidatus Dormibacteria bacterium]
MPFVHLSGVFMDVGGKRRASMNEPLCAEPFLLSAHKTPGRDERSFPTWTLPKVAVAVSGLAPRGWLP